MSGLGEWFAPLTRASSLNPDAGTSRFGIQDDDSPMSTYLSSVQIWWSSAQAAAVVGAMIMTLSDGSVTEKQWQGGNFDQWKNLPTTRNQRFDFQAGERVKSMKISVDPSGLWLNGVTFSTIFDRSFSCTPGPPNQLNWRDVDVGSGLLVGARSDQNSFPSGFAFIFLKPVKSLALTNVTYTTTPTNTTAPIRMIDYMSKSFPNRGTHDGVCKVAESSTDEQSFEWTLGLSAGLSITTSVSAGFFDIVEVGQQATWSIDASISTTNRSTESKTVSWEYSTTVGPGKDIEVMLRYGKGSFKSGYTGTLHVVMESGATVDIPCTGSFSQTVVGVEQVSTTEKTLTD